MFMRSPPVVALAAVLACAGPTVAQPVLYSFNGVANGSLGGQPFFNAPFSFEATADIAQITQQLPGVFAVPSNLDVTIGGFNRAMCLFDDRIVANQNFARVGIGDVGQNLAVLFVDNPAIQSYGLNTSIGPLTGPAIISNSALFPTTAGALNLSAVFNVNFTATVVPEPSSLLLAATGLAAAWRSRRYVRQTLAPQQSPPPTAA